MLFSSISVESRGGRVLVCEGDRGEWKCAVHEGKSRWCYEEAVLCVVVREGKVLFGVLRD